MKLIKFIPLAVAAACLCACDSHSKDSGDNPNYAELRQSRRHDEWVVNTLSDAGVKNAILTQHTLFPYQFVPNGAALNELGCRDLAVLADHYKMYPGDLSVRRGDASEDLYDARVKQVTEALSLAGLDSTRVKIVDVPPSGDGYRGEAVVKIIATPIPGASVSTGTVGAGLGGGAASGAGSSSPGGGGGGGGGSSGSPSSGGAGY